MLPLYFKSALYQKIKYLHYIDFVILFCHKYFVRKDVANAEGN